MDLETDEVRKSLQALTKSKEGRSETARLKDIFDDIEKALSAGVKQAVVHKTLVEKGYTLSLSGFKTAIRRIRKKQQNEHAIKKPTASDTANKEPKNQEKSTGNVFAELNNRHSSEDPRRVTVLHKIDKTLIYGTDEDEQ